MILKNIFYTTLFGTFLFVMDRMQPVMSEQSINDMQGCQALIEFVDQKLAGASNPRFIKEIKNIRTGLARYDAYIQSEIITPNLLKYTDGSTAQANAIQVQIDAYKKSLVTVYDVKYPDDIIVSEFISSLQGCGSKAKPEGADLVLFDAAIVELSNLDVYM